MESSNLALGCRGVEYSGGFNELAELFDLNKLSSFHMYIDHAARSNRAIHIDHEWRVTVVIGAPMDYYYY